VTGDGDEVAGSVARGAKGNRSLQPTMYPIRISLEESVSEPVSASGVSGVEEPGFFFLSNTPYGSGSLTGPPSGS